MSELLLLPVSIGEGLDKLSILDIKMENIKDNRYTDVKKEHQLLANKLEPYIKKTEKYYNMIKKTNKHIWALMDLLRDGIDISDKMYLDLSKETIYANDIRFRIKNKINNITQSSIKEQKSYRVLKTLIIIEDFKHDIKMLTKIIYYFSIMSDELYIQVTNEDHIKFIEYEFDGQIFIIKTLSTSIYETFKYVYDLSNSNTEADVYAKINIEKDYIEKYI